VGPSWVWLSEGTGLRYGREAAVVQSPAPWLDVVWTPMRVSASMPWAWSTKALSLRP
jgi:hypothetical protein